MKLIKNKKLFGVLKVLDVGIIAFILLLVLPMLHYYMKFNEKGFVEQNNLDRFIAQKKRNEIVNQLKWRTKTLDVRVSFKNLKKSDVDKIRVGDRELQPDGTVVGEILWLGDPEPDYLVTNIGSVNNSVYVKTNGDSSLYSLPANIRLLGSISDSGLFTCKDKTLCNLAQFRFDTDRYEAYFIVEDPRLLKLENR